MFLILAFAESAFAGSLVKSRTNEARFIFDFSRSLVEVRDLLHEVFVELVFSCCEIHGILIVSLRKRISFRIGGKEDIHLLRGDTEELLPYLRNCCKCPNCFRHSDVPLSIQESNDRKAGVILAAIFTGDKQSPKIRRERAIHLCSQLLRFCRKSGSIRLCPEQIPIRAEKPIRLVEAHAIIRFRRFYWSMLHIRYRSCSCAFSSLAFHC